MDPCSGGPPPGTQGRGSEAGHPTSSGPPLTGRIPGNQRSAAERGGAPAEERDETPDRRAARGAHGGGVYPLQGGRRERPGRADRRRPPPRAHDVQGHPHPGHDELCRRAPADGAGRPTQRGAAAERVPGPDRPLLPCRSGPGRPLEEADRAGPVPGEAIHRRESCPPTRWRPGRTPGRTGSATRSSASSTPSGTWCTRNGGCGRRPHRKA